MREKSPQFVFLHTSKILGSTLSEVYFICRLSLELIQDTSLIFHPVRPRSHDHLRPAIRFAVCPACGRHQCELDNFSCQLDAPIDSPL
ncbi:hypothetical protein Naga_100023g59 [Nannochloropsis gaditana]|uniref:Uncharacterized protein n=1 Tax=Nannochloropsis gaditana TaxID=72520 RepID=W7T6L9_9STRA|nr:hypothetical protein Naga_100023g59 [Nannochloropsis gaditana]